VSWSESTIPRLSPAVCGVSPGCYAHLGPFARQVIAAIDVKLAELDPAPADVPIAAEQSEPHARRASTAGDLVAADAAGFRQGLPREQTAKPGENWRQRIAEQPHGDAPNTPPL